MDVDNVDNVEKVVNIPETRSVDIIPAEILEHVLDYLNHVDIFCSAKVCRLWERLCQRLVKLRCLKLIPSDILSELLTESFRCDWVSIWQGLKPITYVYHEISNQRVNQLINVCI